MSPINVNVNDVMRRGSFTVELRVIGIPEFRARLWLAKQIIRLAAWVGRFKAEVSVHP